MTPDIPLKRLESFRKELGLDEAKLAALRPYAGQFAQRSRKAGKYLDALFRKVAPRTTLELSLEFFDGSIKHFWTNWYSTLWTRPWDETFLRDLWTQGANSARLGIELQYVMLGEIKCRQFFLRTVRDDVPLERKAQVVAALNVLLDLCMMVRTKGHASYLARCTEPLLQGIFHQTRNPLTVIGGTAMRLMRSGGAEVRGLAQVILDEALRLERMTRDISTYNAVEGAEAVLEPVDVAAFLDRAMDGLKNGPDWPEGLKPAIALDPGHPEVEADQSLLAELFKEVLVNAIEGMPPTARTLAVTSRVDPSSPRHLSIKFLSGGELPRGQDVEQLFLPFNSTKPMGTGFGLAIARSAARKCFGNVALAQADGGVACIVKLPLKGQVDEMGLLSQIDF